jgi:hypothetical protein
MPTGVATGAAETDFHAGQALEILDEHDQGVSALGWRQLAGLVAREASPDQLPR